MASMWGDEVWTDTSFPAAHHSFLYCGVSEGSCVAFKSVLAACVLQMVEHANRVKGRKWAVIGQGLFPKTVHVSTPPKASLGDYLIPLSLTSHFHSVVEWTAPRQQSNVF